MLNNQIRHCHQCALPSGLQLIDPQTGQEYGFSDKGGFFCQVCADLKSDFRLPTRTEFDLEWTEYLNSRDRLLFAFSGGLDSVVTLAHLRDDCIQRGIELFVFTVETGAKGSVAAKNVAKTLEHFGLTKNHQIIDISTRLQTSELVTDVVGTPLSTLDVYRHCWQHGILPCGKLCNAMIDAAYLECMTVNRFTEIVTGGDTPKMSSGGQYSLSWKKPSGITIMRGAYAYGLSKHKNRQYILDKNIPWVDPECGGYDTDCLVPGVFFADLVDGDPVVGVQQTARRFRIIIDYLTERVRFGVIDRDEAIARMDKIEIASLVSYIELVKIFKGIS